MVDYINAEVDCFDCSNDLLIFHSEETTRSKNIKTTWTYKNFVIESISNRPKTAYIKGSIHSFMQNGTNVHDFGLNDLRMAILKLCEELKINIYKTKIHGLEFGVNLQVPFSCSQFLDGLIYYKNTPPTIDKYKGNGYLKRFKQSQYTIKTYDKSLQYRSKGVDVKNDTLRIEIKVTTMDYLLKKGIKINTINDLTNTTYLNQLGVLLVTTIQRVVYIDLIDKYKYIKESDLEYVQSCKMSEYWVYMKSILHRKTFNRRVDRLREINLSLGANSTFQFVINSMIEKWNRLLNDVPKLATAKNSSMSQCYPYYIIPHKETQIRYCQVTGLDISHQRKNSKHLSENSVKIIYANNKVLFESLLKRYAPREYNDNVYYLVAKNIRNYLNNKKVSERNKSERDKHQFKLNL